MTPPPSSPQQTPLPKHPKTRQIVPSDRNALRNDQRDNSLLRTAVKTKRYYFTTLGRFFCPLVFRGSSFDLVREGYSWVCQQKTGKITLQPVLINKSTFCTEIRKIEIPRHGSGGLELVKPAREPASSRESCPFAAPCGPRRKKNDRGQRSAFPSETSRFKPV